MTSRPKSFVRTRLTQLNSQKASNSPTNSNVISTLIKQARKSGQLNLSDRNLKEVPRQVYLIQEAPESAPTECLSFDHPDDSDKWWEINELKKLFLSSNQLPSISQEIGNLSSLVVLDLHDNQLETLPPSFSNLVHMQNLNLNCNKLATLPECLFALCNLVTFSASRNQLKTVSTHLDRWTVLEELDLSFNQLEKIPPTIGYLCRLTRLDLSQNKLTTLPPTMGDLDRLKQFYANDNQIVEIPKEISKIINLEIVALQRNKIATFPHMTAAAFNRTGRSALKELLLGGNRIAQMPDEHLEGLDELSMLDVRDNCLETIPENIHVLSSLERIDLSNNTLSNLPAGLGRMPKLKIVTLDGNPLRSIRRDVIMRGPAALMKHLRDRTEPAPSFQSPEQQQAQVQSPPAHEPVKLRLSHSKQLDLSGSQLTEVPASRLEPFLNQDVRGVNLSKNRFNTVPAEALTPLARDLAEIDMSFNQVQRVPASIAVFTMLTRLNLRKNQLADLPAEMAALAELREIDISANRFTAFPAVIFRFRLLEQLLAGDNRITQIPVEGVCGLKQLNGLDVMNNSISHVPPELGSCRNLRMLKLDGNSFRVPRPAIVAKGTIAVLEYLRSRQSDAE